MPVLRTAREDSACITNTAVQQGETGSNRRDKLGKDDLKRDIWIVIISFGVGLLIGIKWEFIIDKLQYAGSLFFDTGWN